LHTFCRIHKGGRIRAGSIQILHQQCADDISFDRKIEIRGSEHFRVQFQCGGVWHTRDGVARDTEERLLPINPYGRTKLMIEQILQDYHRAYGFASVSLRYFNAAGADADAEIGELREDETHIIPLAIEAGKKVKEFKLFGTDFDTPDGTCVRDYVHVTDLARGHVLALQKAHKEKICASYNLGSGIPTSNRELLNNIQRFTGAMNIREEPRRAGDPPVLVADISRTVEN
jgi:UDP-glucose 4-epimerase